ncbi:MAG: TetR/AcrR family transcriptional regulator [Candidatus Levyibacteriota bacterium]
MAIRQRAVDLEGKEERRHAILDAAERLLTRAPDRIASVAEVADEAGLAKGTVYLYFPSKDELLLALHERHVEGYFSALIGFLERSPSVAIGDMLEITLAHLAAKPAFLSLATRCQGIVETEVPRETAAAFRLRMGERLAAAGAGLERHFPELAQGDGVALLRHTYALILGLWQMCSANAVPSGLAGEACAGQPFEYPRELARALRALWEGAIGSRLRPPAAGESRAAVG